jgi:hypothetical protein
VQVTQVELEQIISELKTQIQEAVKGKNLFYTSMDEAETIAKELEEKITSNRWAVLGWADELTQELIDEAITLSFVYNPLQYFEQSRRLEAGSVNDAHFSLLLYQDGEIDQNSLDFAYENLSHLFENRILEESE